MSKSKLNDIIAAIKAVNEEIHISKIKVGDIVEHDESITEWDIRKLGGLNSIKSSKFPEEDKDLVGTSNLKKTNSYIKKLETQLGNKLSLQEELTKVVEANVQPLGRIPFKKHKSVKGSLRREVVAMLNDTHVGLIVDPEEIGELNSFDFKEAGRRFAYFIKEVADYKPHVRSEVKKLHLILNGDMIAGIIHGLDTKGIHLLIHQKNALFHILTHGITFLAQEFKDIEVHGIAGNHCRAVHKGHGQRPVSEIYDSLVNDVFYGISVAFRNNPRIGFNFPKTPYGFINLPGGRAMFAHGDHVFSKAIGNVGTAINVKALSIAIKNFNSGEVVKGNAPIKLLLLGHVHCYAHFITDDDVEVYIAPSLSGADSYSHSLTINTNFAAQVVFESTPEFILGDSRLIRVLKADKLSELDKIIPTYNKELKWIKS